jgi:hypothetical protein
MNNYSWEIKRLTGKAQDQGLSNVIDSISWEYKVEDSEGNTAKLNGRVILDPPSQENFIEKELLTKQEIVGWLESLLNLDRIKSIVDRKLSESLDNKSIELEL